MMVLTGSTYPASSVMPPVIFTARQGRVVQRAVAPHLKSRPQMAKAGRKRVYTTSATFSTMGPILGGTCSWMRLAFSMERLPTVAFSAAVRCSKSCPSLSFIGTTTHAASVPPRSGLPQPAAIIPSGTPKTSCSLTAQTDHTPRQNSATAAPGCIHTSAPPRAGP